MQTASIELSNNPNLASIPIRGVSGIYCFIHRETGMCYVGSTNDMHARITGHINLARRVGKTCFHRALSKYGIAAFDFEILEECEISELMDRERFYIVLMNAASLDGFNTREKPDSGNIYGKVSAATRARIGAASKGRVFSPEARRLMGEKRKGRKASEQTREKLRTRTVSEDTRAKIRLAMAGKKKTAEHIQKLRLLKLGVPAHPNTRDGLLRGCRDRIQTEEEKRKRAAHHIGRKRTPEQRERMRLAQLNMSPEKKARIDFAKRRPRSEECKARIRAGIAAALLKKKNDNDKFCP